MAHFALVDTTVTIAGGHPVETVVVVINEDCLDADGNESEAVGIAHLKSVMGDDITPVQTSYNHNFRHRFAAIGMVWREDLDAFIFSEGPYPSWIFNADTLEWDPPVERVDFMQWNEDTLSWNRPEGCPPSWTLGEHGWESPVPYPGHVLKLAGDPRLVELDDDQGWYEWNEDTLSWEPFQNDQIQP